MIDKAIIDEVLKQSRIAFNNNEIPVGAVIFKNNKIIAVGSNNRQNNHNILGHAEINAIISAENEIKDWRLDGYSMIVSLEPCEMCSIIIKECRLDKIYYFLDSNKQVITSINKVKIEENQYSKEYTELSTIINQFFSSKR